MVSSYLELINIDFFFFIENLLNASKSQSLNNESINNRLEQEDIEEFEDRHERTGSVKFADQSDEGKEVRYFFFLLPIILKQCPVEFITTS